MMPFWCACWTALADVDEQLQRARGSSLCLSQYSVIGTPLTSSITKYGRPVSVAPASRTLRDVGVVHHRQRLPLGLEARDHLPGVHAELDDLLRRLTGSSARPCRRRPCRLRRSPAAACRGRSKLPGPSRVPFTAGLSRKLAGLVVRCEKLRRRVPASRSSSPHAPSRKRLRALLPASRPRAASKIVSTLRCRVDSAWLRSLLASQAPAPACARCRPHGIREISAPLRRATQPSPALRLVKQEGARVGPMAVRPSPARTPSVLSHLIQRQARRRSVASRVPP